jgi:predicted PurR-regulated permease PerM
MVEKTGNEPTPDSQEVKLLASAQESRAAWQRLGLRLRAVTPADIARYLLIGGILALLGWLISYAWPALVPFVIGAGLAYAVLPLVNSLDRVMPRQLAALLAMVLAIGLLLLAVAAVVPVLFEQFLRFVDVVPSAEEIRTFVERLDPLLERLPNSLQEQIISSVDEASLILLRQLDSLSNSVPEFLAGILLKIIGVLGAALGLLVLPTWLLLVLADQRRMVRSLNQLLPDAVQPDFWAVVRITDRAFRAFFQNQVTQGLVAFGLTYLVVLGLNSSGYLQAEYPLVVALFVGLMELVPEIGPLVAILVLGIGTWLNSPPSAVFAILLYLVIHRLAGAYVGTRSRRRSRELHPALLVVGTVALSELGLIWVLLSVPLLTAARDLLTYAHGRLSTPARPAGLIPGEEAQVQTSAEESTRTPLVYRRAATRRKVNL